MGTTSDVVVLGGGIIGLTCAYELARTGRSVTLIDRRGCGSGASWAAPGILNPPSPHRTDGLAAFQLASLKLHATLSADLRERCGIDSGYAVCGAVEVFYENQQVQMGLSRAEALADERTEAGEPVLTMLDREQIAEIVPGVGADSLGALHCRRTAQIRTPRLLQALKASCVELGVRIIEQVNHVDLAIESDRIAGVTADETRIACRFAVLAAGAWSSEFKRAGQPLVDVRPVKGQIILLDCKERPFGPIAEDRFCYIVPREEGLVLIGSTVEPDAGFSVRVTAAGISEVMAKALRLMPLLGEAAVVNMWSGLRPDTPDHRPFIGWVPDVEGLIAATGHYRLGITLAPATAQAVCQLIDSGTTVLDLSLFRVDREHGVEVDRPS